jgi:hypothetical protein
MILSTNVLKYFELADLIIMIIGVGIYIRIIIVLDEIKAHLKLSDYQIKEINKDLDDVKLSRKEK